MLSHLPPQRFTDFSRWRAAVCDYFVPLNIQVLTAAPVDNLVANDVVGPIKVTALKTSAQKCIRTAAMASQADQLIYKVSLQLRGHSEIVQDGQRVVLAPGQWSLYNTTRPYEVAVGQAAQFIILQLPASAIAVWSSCLQSGVGHVFEARQGSACIALGTLELALRERAHLSDAMSRNIADSVLNMLGLGIAEHLQTEAQLPSSQNVRLAQLRRMQAWIACNLHNPELSVAALAAQFHVSRRYLYKLFAMQAQTPADYIQQTRLERCKYLLAQAGGGKRISDLAWQHGFSDAAAFSHAFKHRFGLSPSAWRQLQVQDG